MVLEGDEFLIEDDVLDFGVLLDLLGDFLEFFLEVRLFLEYFSVLFVEFLGVDLEFVDLFSEIELHGFQVHQTHFVFLVLLETFLELVSLLSGFFERSFEVFILLLDFGE